MTTSIVKTPDLRVLQTIAGLAAHFGKLWCFPNQFKLLELLRTKHGRTICRRTLNNHLAALERDGYIRRQRRHRKNNQGGLELHSTIYVILAKTVRLLGGAARFTKVANSHHWAKRWVSAVQNTAQRMDPKTDIIGELPKKQAAFAPNVTLWLRQLRIKHDPL